MLQQQETYAQQLAALHELVKAQAILESQAVTAVNAGAATLRSSPAHLPTGHAAGLPMRHAASPSEPSQHRKVGIAEGHGAPDRRMRFALPAAGSQRLHPPPPFATPQHVQGGFDSGDFSRMSAPLLQPAGGRLFTWHEEAGDVGGNNNMLQCRSFPSLRRNSWDLPLPADANTRVQPIGQELWPSAACGDAQQALGAPPLRKRQALEPHSAPGQVTGLAPHSGIPTKSWPAYGDGSRTLNLRHVDSNVPLAEFTGM